MLGLLNRWNGRTGAIAILLTPYCLAVTALAQRADSPQLFTLEPSPRDANAATYDGRSSSAFPPRSVAPVRPVPTPLAPIPYTGSTSQNATDTNAGYPPGTVESYYYYDESGKRISGTGLPDFSAMSPSNVGQGRLNPKSAKPKFDYRLAPIQPAARPRRAFMASSVVSAESVNGTPSQSNSLISQDKILSADEFSSRRSRSRSSNGNRNQQASSSVLNNMRRFVTIENDPSSRPSALPQAQRAPKCPNCGKRRPNTPVAALPSGGARR